MVDLGVELDVGGETTPEIVAWSSDESESEFALEHEDGTSKEGAVGEKLEDERRGDLVWSIGDADVKVGEFGLAEVSKHNV